MVCSLRAALAALALCSAVFAAGPAAAGLFDDEVARKQIAEQHEIAATTVRDYVGSLCRKLGAANRTEAASRGIALGLVRPPR